MATQSHLLPFVLLCVTVRMGNTSIQCDSLPAQPCLALWPGKAPNETNILNETRSGDDGNGCGVGRNEPCDGVKDVSFPTLTPFLVSNGTGAAIIIAPGGGYQHLAFSKEGLDIARMYNALGVSGKAAAWYERTDRCPLAAFVLKYRVPARPQLPG